jgi:ubiquinone/menaquinone biosynthesis C-methylase UbiE
VARRWPQDGYSNRLIAEHGSNTHLALVERWADITGGEYILKTDLFDVAFGPAPFLFNLPRRDVNIVGIDISGEVVDKARSKARDAGSDASRFLCCDVRHIPIRNNAIDLIISDSTLDHFANEKDIIDALNELHRVLGTGGTLILTLDNANNLTYPPYMIIRLWMRLGLAPYFIGRTLSSKRLGGILENIGFVIEDRTAIFHCPHPDILVRWLEGLIHRVGAGRFDGVIRRALNLVDRLEGKKTKYWTGRYIAVKAVKIDGDRRRCTNSS